jgi:hypothetical protein
LLEKPLPSGRGVVTANDSKASEWRGANPPDAC